MELLEAPVALAQILPQELALVLVPLTLRGLPGSPVPMPLPPPSGPAACRAPATEASSRPWSASTALPFAWPLLRRARWIHSSACCWSVDMRPCTVRLLAVHSFLQYLDKTAAGPVG